MYSISSVHCRLGVSFEFEKNLGLRMTDRSPSNHPGRLFSQPHRHFLRPIPLNETTIDPKRQTCTNLNTSWTHVLVVFFQDVRVGQSHYDQLPWILRSALNLRAGQEAGLPPHLEKDRGRPGPEVPKLAQLQKLEPVNCAVVASQHNQRK